MAFTRRKIKGRAGIFRGAGTGGTTSTSSDYTASNTSGENAEMLEYPGGFTFGSLTQNFNATWTNDANLGTDKMDVAWFRNTGSTTS